jgi:signal transduction histidine kinase
MKSTVLIVDDEQSGRMALEAILEGQGYNLKSAMNGPEALEKALAMTPDLILLDVMMPGMNGYEVCRQIRSTPVLAEVPIIILTALDDRESLLRGIEAGADDFLTKPVDRQELRARVRAITRLNRYRTLLLQRESLREMAERVVAAQEQERQRISRELHDDLGQALTAHMLNLRMLQEDPVFEKEHFHQHLGSLTSETNEIINKMRLLAQDLRPPILDALGLSIALKTYCHEFSRRTRIPIVIDIDPVFPSVTDLQAIILYRILQEALNNIIKHAQASQVWVELTIEDDHISLTVQDNGHGFDPNGQPKNGIGIAGMKERLALVGGQLFLSSTSTRGTILSAHLPLKAAMAKEREEA